ncbi:RNA polymerase sigma factor [Actinophytocola algeriensis]|uniref:DNA-directed RNA polymerase specialized sigma24 family protein n=1 Tax=Actinophytocola algeriensis TaxID=1768010 RepID=A0A7W7Q8D2_9PSEU|nr:RNA polymerase sigma factor [Actinophytocola algeriensis]MBB4908748.1 DNA-directed RNA polymerase specialized sigma24 family protein [Actinophytocola algeriensis]MBE1474865.1 DNA-directed RNA polymerase specialized sigma24 family protein [Actinophytocola algeriensis]
MNTDDDLLERLRAGEPAARRELFERCRTRLRPFFHARLSAREDIDDSVSEVVTRALEGIGKSARIEVLDAWLAGIARNVLMERYTEGTRRRKLAESGRDRSRQPAEPALELARDAGPPEVPDDLLYLLGKRELWQTLGRAVASLKPTMRDLMREHLRLSVEQGRPVVGRALGAAVGLPGDRVDRQLNRAREATREAIVALVVVRAGRDDCTQLADPVPGVSSELNPDRTRTVLAHAAGCPRCAPRAESAGRYSRWAVGPALYGLAEDEEERRRAIAAIVTRGGEGRPDLPMSAAVPGVTGGVTGGAVSAVDRARAAVSATLGRVPGSDTIVQLVHLNPELLRRVVTAIVGVVALVATGMAVLISSQPPTGHAEAMPDRDEPRSAAGPAPGPGHTPPPVTPVFDQALHPPGAVQTTSPHTSEPAPGGSPESTPPTTAPPESTTSPQPPPPPCVPAWQTVTAPAPAPDHTGYLDVTARTATDAWMVGWTGAATDRGPLVAHWDGHSWTATPVEGPGEWSQLQSVTAPAPELAWAVGNSGPTRRGFVLRWNGSGWTESPVPAVPGATSTSLLGVWAANPAEAWAVGWAAVAGSTRVLVLRWAGGQWSLVDADDTPGAVLTAVGGTSAGDVWAVGRTANGALLLHWDGTGWHHTPADNVPGADLSHVRASAPDDAWAVGTAGNTTGRRPLALHWDGTRWSDTDPAPGLAGTFTDVAPVSSGEVWFVGARDTGVPGTTLPLLMRRERGRWTAPAPVEPSTTGWLTAIHATNRNAVWAVGMLSGTDGSQRPLLRRHHCT